MKAFGYGIAAGVLSVAAGLTTVMTGISVLWPERMPAPPISTIANVDEKLRFLRERPELDPQILAVGSSITWRQLDGRQFDPERDGRFLNGALVQLKTHQTLALAKFYLEHFQNVRDLLVLTSLTDFQDCTNDPPLLFDAEDTARYVFEGWPSAYFYARYFAPKRFLTGVRRLPQRMQPYTGDFYIDAYGSGPIQLSRSEIYGLRYGDVETDPACISAMIELSRFATGRGIRLTVVFSPIHPNYPRQYPDATERLYEIVAEVRRGVRKHNTAVLDMIEDRRFEAADFFDDFHLQWSAVPRLSRSIRDAMRGSDDKFADQKNGRAAIGRPMLRETRAPARPDD